MPLNIFIAEDSLLLRERLVQLIEENEGMRVIGHSVCAQEARRQIIDLAPDIALLDIHLQRGNAFDILADIRLQAPATRVALMTENTYPAYRERAFSLGAAACIDKAMAGDQLVSALRRLESGRCPTLAAGGRV